MESLQRNGVDTIINGHASPMARKDLEEYAAFTRDFVAYAEGARKAGKAVDEAAAEYKVPPQYKGYVATAPNLSVRDNVQIAYDELKGK